jgi:ABC-type amino acid transport substrate-binding protein
MKKIVTLILLVSCALVRGQSDSMIIHYYENYPYAYTEGGSLKGIEIDIISEYIKWLRNKKNVSVKPVYKPYKEFSAFYNSVKTGDKNLIGLGSVTNTRERDKEVTFSAPYLQNVAVMITSGTVQTMKSREPEEAKPVLEKLTAFVVKSSSHSTYLDQIRKKYAPSMKITYTETQDQVLENIVNTGNSFGYVDIVAYWAFLKKHQGKFLKIQKAFSEPKDNMGFISPKGGTQINNLNEFLESGFGFTSTKVYREILERYLGHEIIESVEIK